MAQQFTTALTLPNPYVTHTLNSMELVNIITHERKDWTRKDNLRNRKNSQYPTTTSKHYQVSTRSKYVSSVVATTYHKGQMITQAINLSNGISSGKFTRELDKEPLLNQCPIYTDCFWSVLQLSNPTLMSMLHPHVCLTSSSRPPCVLHVP